MKLTNKNSKGYKLPKNLNINKGTIVNYGMDKRMENRSKGLQPKPVSLADLKPVFNINSVKDLARVTYATILCMPSDRESNKSNIDPRKVQETITNLQQTLNNLQQTEKPDITPSNYFLDSCRALLPKRNSTQPQGDTIKRIVPELKRYLDAIINSRYVKIGHNSELSLFCDDVSAGLNKLVGAEQTSDQPSISRRTLLGSLGFFAFRWGVSSG